MDTKQSSRGGKEKQGQAAGAADALRGAPGRDGLTAQERLLLEALPRGRRSAVGLHELARRTGLNPRHLRELIVHLIVEHGVGIGSSTDSWLGGYYLIQDEEDLRCAARHLAPRVHKLAARLRSLERIAAERFAGQVRLFEGAER